MPSAKGVIANPTALALSTGWPGKTRQREQVKTTADAPGKTGTMESARIVGLIAQRSSPAWLPAAPQKPTDLMAVLRAWRPG